MSNCKTLYEAMVEEMAVDHPVVAKGSAFAAGSHFTAAS